MKPKNYEIVDALLRGETVAHGLGGDYDFSEVITSADLGDVLRRLVSTNPTYEERLNAATSIRALLISALTEISEELVESWDE
jgi:hypothetical protein